MDERDQGEGSGGGGGGQGADDNENDAPAAAMAQTPTPPQSPFANSPMYDPTSPVDAPNGDQDQQREHGEGGEWQAVQDDEGRTYYYNSVTGESSWEAPPGFTAAAASVDLASVDAAASGDDQAVHSAQQDAAAAVAEAEREEVRWTGYKDDEGRTYYYNEGTGETQWERPAEGPGIIVVEEEDMEAEEGNVPEGGEGREGGEEDDDAAAPQDEAAAAEGMAVEEDKKMEQEEEKEEQRDPKEVALEEAEKALARPDAVLEHGASFCFFGFKYILVW